MNAKLETTTVTQSANEVLKTKEKKLYYLVVTTPKGSMTINVGEKTHEKVKNLTDVTTKLQGVGGTEDKKNNK